MENLTSEMGTGACWCRRRSATSRLSGVSAALHLLSLVAAGSRRGRTHISNRPDAAPSHLLQQAPAGGAGTRRSYPELEHRAVFTPLLHSQQCFVAPLHYEHYQSLYHCHCHCRCITICSEFHLPQVFRHHHTRL